MTAEYKGGRSEGTADDELLDALDENGTHIDTVTRGEAHRRGIWHRSFHCWIAMEEDGRRFLLFQRRSAAKKLYPNMLDITAAGHLLAGETAADGLRELAEELGLVAHEIELVPLGRRQECRHVGAILDREFADVYFLRGRQALDTYRLQPQEVAALCRLELDDGLRLFSGETGSAPITGFELDRGGTLSPVAYEVTKAAFLPRTDNYYLAVCIMAARFLAGERYLAIS